MSAKPVDEEQCSTMEKQLVLTMIRASITVWSDSPSKFTCDVDGSLLPLPIVLKLTHKPIDILIEFFHLGVQVLLETVMVVKTANCIRQNKQKR